MTPSAYALAKSRHSCWPVARQQARKGFDIFGAAPTPALTSAVVSAYAATHYRNAALDAIDLYEQAIRSAQARLHRGLDIQVPVLIGTSNAAYRSATWSEEAHRADAVLDPADMWRWGPGLGRHVTLVRFDGARHDLALSRKPVRDTVFAELAAWIGAYFPR